MTAGGEGDTLLLPAKRGFLTHRRLAAIVALLAIMLTLPSLAAGLLIDDYSHKLLFTGSKSDLCLLNSPLDLFRFFDGNTIKTARLIDYGAVPWWTYPGIRGAFWRPLASMTHWLDYHLWPASPPLMHLQSVLWYGATVFVVALLYRDLMGVVPAAGLAALLFAVDDAHGMPVGFLSNRSDLPAVVFGALCLIAHDRWRRCHQRGAGVAAPILLLASLLCKEAGISTCGYLSAYEVFIDESRRSSRVLALLPCVIVVIAWRVAWSKLGYGVEELGVYIDPLRSPWRFGSAVVERGPLLLLGQFALPPADVVLFLGPTTARLLWIAAIALLALLAWLLAPIIRGNRIARFWAVGMLLAVLPACTTFSSDRLLMFAGIGAMPLLAQFILEARHSRPFSRTQMSSAARVVAGALLVIHGILAPLLLLGRSGWPAGPARFRAAFLMPPPDGAFENQDLIVVNPPEVFGVCGSLFQWAGENVPLPRHVRALTSSALQPVDIYRPDDRTLIVHPRAGFLAGRLDHLFRGEWRRFAVGDKIVLTGLVIEVTQVGADGRPEEAQFQFFTPLESRTLRWICWIDGQFVAYTPPMIGEHQTLAANDWLGR